MPSRPTSMQRDRVIADRYVAEELLGRGGMGAVWRARDRLLQRTVAIKEIVLPPSLPEEEREKQKARILREARSAARLSHPNAVTMFDVLEEEGHSYIVMELVDAGSLSDLIRRRGPLPPEEVARIGVGILDALVAAHSAGIVHRDVKPGNVMVGDDLVKLADFGIATMKGDPKITQTGLILGSPSYMAPEQARSEPAVPATDLWGLGVTLYTAVEGVGPFERGEPIPTLTAILTDEPRTPVRAGPLEDVIGRLLTKDAADRPAPDRIRRDLEAIAGGVATTIRLPDAEQAGTPTDESPREPEPTPPARAEPRRPTGSTWKWLAALALVAAAILAAVLLPALLDDRRTAETAAPSDGQRREASPSPEDQGGGGAPVPEDWTIYTHPTTGYRIAHPPNWTVKPIDTRTDFVAPNGDYLRVDYTTTPGPTQEDHVQQWQSLSGSFAQDHDDYREIRIEPVTFRGWPGAEWEYGYEGRHAINLGFTVSPDYGFALNFVTAEGRWEGSQDEFEALKASFVAPDQG